MHDAVIVGAGMAGLVAALRATELGADVLLLEAGQGDSYPCNSRMSGGNLHVARLSPFLDPKVLRQEIDRATDRHVRPVVRDVLTANAARAVDWLVRHGAHVAARSDGEWEQCVLHPITDPTGDRLAPVGRGPDLILRRLAADLAARGVQFWQQTTATGVGPGGSGGWRVDAVKAGTPVQVEAGWVVLADGGFQANDRLTAAHIGSADALPWRRNAGTAHGFGLETCVRLGAKTSGLDVFYGCLVSADVRSDPTLSPYPMFDYLAMAGVLVASDGTRIGGPASSGVALANELAHRGAKHAWVVVDERGWGKAKDLGIVSVARRLDDLRSTVQVHDLTALSAALGVPLPDGTERLTEPPLRAFPVIPAITHTMGGPLTDDRMVVIDTTDRPIAGLSAIGSTAGGFEGGPNAGYTGGLLRAATTGLIWAEAAFS